MKKELTIKICGKAGHGKTTMAQTLDALLRALGFQVLLIDKQYSDLNNEKPLTDEELERNLAILIQNCNINIETVLVKCEINL